MQTAEVSAPQSVDDSGIRRNFLEDLALKTLFLNGELTLRELADRTHLSMGIIDELFQTLRKEQLCEVKGMTGGIHRIVTTQGGKRRALDLLSMNQYSGPCPVSLDDYVARVRSQSVQTSPVRPEDVERCFGHLVLSPEMLTRVGTALVSGTSIFLYGPTGGGKTSIAETLPNIYPDGVWIPYAVEVDNQVIVVYDTGVHKALEQPTTDDLDTRWIFCRRPRVFVGGELTFEMLDLVINPVAKFYSAPVQMKANNGVLIIDDFGRQRISPEQLLNRWIVPLDRRVDFLSLAGGKKFEIPFDSLVVFATNLNPLELADEAFLRRIQNKISVGYPGPEQFLEIFEQVCARFGITYDPEVGRHFVYVVTEQFRQPLRPCYPLDIVRQICWAARYAGSEPRLDQETVELACRNYFLPPEQAA
jgi:predicted ATPase with chaperone activity